MFIKLSPLKVILPKLCKCHERTTYFLWIVCFQISLSEKKLEKVEKLINIDNNNKSAWL